MAHISISNLTVEFAVFGTNARSLKNTFIEQATGGRVIAGAKDIVTVRAIDNLNIEIKHGDRIGITGHNGSGKSTLLRVLAGIYKPTHGNITIHGKVSTLLDPAAGMDMEATGYENIYLRGYLLGMSNREIRAKIDEIAEFTELGDFLKLPMKTYSTGMAARLAFAISTAAETEVLLVDEGIGAGDAGFQSKAEQRVTDMFAKTSIILIASHSEELLAHFCNRKIKMEHGRLIEESEFTPARAQKSVA